MKYQNNLKQIRLQKGMTLRQVASAMGLQCEDRLSLWEHGHAMPSAINLIKLCRIYSVKIEEIFDSKAPNDRCEAISEKI